MPVALEVLDVEDSPLRKARLRRGMTQAELAEHVCATRDAVSDWERGRRAMPEDQRRMAARVLNAPELIFDGLQVIFESECLLESTGWLGEELPEAIDALVHMQARLRRGQSIEGLDKDVVWDLRTAIDNLIVALSRHGVDVFAGFDRHVEHLRRRGYLRDQRRAA